MFSILFWLASSVFNNIYMTYREVTGEGGYDLLSGFYLFLSTMLVSILCESIILIGLIMLFLNYVHDKIKLKGLTMFFCLLIIPLISQPLSWDLFYSVKHNRLNSYFDGIINHIKFIFTHITLNWPMFIIPLVLAICFTIYYKKKITNA